MSSTLLLDEGCAQTDLWGINLYHEESDEAWIEFESMIATRLGEGLRLTVAGVIIGGAVALYAGRWVKPVLFNVKPSNPLVLAGVVTVLLVAATLASLIPALRAARVDPNVALPSE